jgi:hypothetical protein
MLKFFRKIRQNLLMENNIGKYFKYAIGEIILVVIGILIALSINNWNQDRIYSKERKYLVSELLTEFENNLEQIKNVSSRNQSNLSKYDTILQLLPSLTFPGDEKKLSELMAESGIYGFGTFNPSEGMINSMSNTSNFQHIDDKTLRRNLLNWSGYVSDVKENENMLFLYKSTITDYLSSFLILGNREKVRNLNLKGSLVTNPLELRNRLIYWYSLKNQYINEIIDLTKKMEEIIEQLKQELNNQ